MGHVNNQNSTQYPMAMPPNLPIFLPASNSHKLYRDIHIIYKLEKYME